MRRIIITADDYGLVHTINQGIETALAKGCINTVSAFVNGRDSQEKLTAPAYLERLHSRFPQAHVGVHLSVTAGKPVSPYPSVRSLLKKSRPNEFMDYDQYDYQSVRISELTLELRAQIDLFKSTGIPLDHLSCHHGTLCIFPDFFKVYMDLAVEYGVPIRNPIPISRLYRRGFWHSKIWNESLMAAFRLLDDIWWTKMLGVAVHVRPGNLQKMMTLYTGGKLQYADYTIDTFYRVGTPNRLRKILQHLPGQGVSELIVHPKAVDEDNFVPNGIALRNFQERETELRTLIRLAPMANLLKAYGIALTSFTEAVKDPHRTVPTRQRHAD